MASASRKARKTFSGLLAKDTMQTNDIALGHGFIFSMTERSISQDLVGLAQSLAQGRPASLRADIGQKKNFRRGVRAGSVPPFYFAWGCFRDFLRRTVPP